MKFAPLRKFNIICLFVLLCTLSGNSSAEHWEYFTNRNNVKGLAAYGDYVWASTSGGLVRWNIHDHSYDEIPLWKSNGTVFNSICVDPQGNVWSYKAGDGLWKYDGTEWTRFTPDETIGAYFSSRSIRSDTHGTIWSTAYNEVVSFDGTEWHRYTEQNGPMGDHYTCLTCDAEGNVWVSGFEDNNENIYISKFDGMS